MRVALTAALAIAAAAAIASCGHADGVAAAPGARPSPAASPTGATGAAGGNVAAQFRSSRTHASVALPVRLRISAIGVDTPLVQLGLDRHGAVDVPSSWQQAGWYVGSARPGQPGPAVLLGHVDSTSGPAVFYRLPLLRTGDRVEVTRADGTVAAFRVSGRLQVAKSRFPTDLVYGPSLEPSLHLVTCGGSFDNRTGHYRDNIIVSAVPA